VGERPYERCVGRRSIQVRQTVHLAGVVDGAIQENSAPAQDCQAIARSLDVCYEVCREEDRQPVCGHSIQQYLQELATSQCIQVGKRFIEHKRVAPRTEGDRKPELRCLTARQRVGALAERDIELLKAALRVPSVEGALQTPSHCQVVGDGKATEYGRLLRHIGDICERSRAVLPRVDSAHLNLTGVRALEGQPGAYQGCLAGAIRPDERCDMPGLH